MSLIGTLTLTSALLLALAPAPLAPDAVGSLLALDTPDSLDVIFKTDASVEAGRWRYIYVHQSRTPSGSAMTLGQNPGGLGDHFVIGNGDGSMDGEIQIAQRWTRQLPPLPPQGASSIDTGCVSVCLIGDFDAAAPTPMQMRRLTQLVTTLQGKLRLPGDRVLMVGQAAQAAGIGNHFPVETFRRQLFR